jgi:hypothetical protein
MDPRSFRNVVEGGVGPAIAPGRGNRQIIGGAPMPWGPGSRDPLMGSLTARRLRRHPGYRSSSGPSVIGRNPRQNGEPHLRAAELHEMRHRRKTRSSDRRSATKAEERGIKLFQSTKIYKSPRLTVIFSGIRIYVSSSMPIRPCP